MATIIRKTLPTERITETGDGTIVVEAMCLHVPNPIRLQLEGYNQKHQPYNWTIHLSKEEALTILSDLAAVLGQDIVPEGAAISSRAALRAFRGTKRPTND